MDSISVSLTPLQLLLSLAFQIWMVVFPIIIIRKLNQLMMLLQEQNRDDSDKESS